MPDKLDGGHLHVLDLAIAEVKDNPHRRQYLEHHWPGVLDQLHTAVLAALRDGSLRWQLTQEAQDVSTDTAPD